MRLSSLFLVVLALLTATVAIAQTNVRVRGTIVAVDGNVMAVKSRDGRDLKLQLPDNVSVAVAKAVRFEDLKEGDYVGVTTVAAPDGALTAVEVHYLAPTVPDGHIAWDLQPNSMMTNANVRSVVKAVDKREITVQYKDGSKRILVPENAPIVRAVPGTRADLTPGEYIFAGATQAADGTLTAPRIQVSKEGVRPPQ